MRKSYLSMLRGGLFSVLCLCMMSMQVFAQSTISGTVIDKDSGEPLVGATVVVKGTTTGVLTNETGRFGIEASPSDVLLFSFATYATQEITVGDRTTINVALITDLSLEEVVVTGYSSQRKRDITGAVSVVDVEELNETVASSFIQKLEGRSAGVTTSTSGAPGAGTAVRIRGIGAFGNNDPLYVIDGVPVQDNFNNQINPNDIETIQVLKDASAASIYGTRANNGVIIVTTKKGKAGKTKVTYDGYVGVQNTVGKYNLVVNPAEYSEAVWRSHENAGLAIPEGVPYSAGRGTIPTYYYDGNVSGYGGTGSVDESTYSFPNNLIMASNQSGTDWWDETFNPALMTEHTVGVSGGTENSSFYLSAGYLKQDGTMIHTDFDRVSLRANSSFKARRFTFGENLAISRASSVGQSSGNQSEQNTMTQILKAQSIIPIYDVSGVNFAGGKANGLSNGTNPVAKQFRNKDNRGNFSKVLGNAYAELDIIDGLKARTSFGVDFFQNFTGGFGFPSWENSEPSTVNGWSENWQTGLNWTWTNTLAYDNTFNDVHNFQALVGYESIKRNFRQIGGGLNNYFSDSQDAWYLNNGLADPETDRVNSNGNFSTVASIFAKVDYAFDDKYLLSATVRRDGSSNFGTEKYGVFPAFSVGWRVSNEAFLQDVAWIEDLKLRFGWGKTGKDQVPTGNAFDRFGGGPESSFYDIAGTGSLATGYALTARGNANTKWEENISTNIGLDASLFAGKINVVLDIWQRDVNDLIYNPRLPGTAGSASPAFVNIGDMKNTGIDLSVTYAQGYSSGLNFDVTLALGAFDNEIVSIDGSVESFFSNNSGRIGETSINQLGNPIGSFYGFTSDGVFLSQEEVNAHAMQDGAAPGRLRFKDLNGDNVINDDDKSVIGSPWADFTGGLNLGLSYNNWDASLFVFASVGNEIFNYNKLFEVFRFFNTNIRTDVLDRSWHPTLNPSGDLPILDENDTFSERPSSFYVEDGSYLRMKNIQIGYTLPRIEGISKLRLFVQAQNAFTITGYEGIDPALSNFNVRGNSDQNAGNDFGNYPSAKIFMAGISLGF